MAVPSAPEVDCEQQHAALTVDDGLAAVEFYTQKLTLEGVGPHTKRDLRYIETLKRKHGIDYDSHASYRFIER